MAFRGKCRAIKGEREKQTGSWMFLCAAFLCNLQNVSLFQSIPEVKWYPGFHTYACLMTFLRTTAWIRRSDYLLMEAEPRTCLFSTKFYVCLCIITAAFMKQ